MARRASPRASDQNSVEECANSTTLVNGGNEIINLEVADDQRWRSLQHHKVVATELGENAAVAKQAYDQDLAEHYGMDVHKRLEGDAQLQRLGGGKLKAAKQTCAMNGFDHLKAAEGQANPLRIHVLGIECADLCIPGADSNAL